MYPRTTFKINLWKKAFKMHIFKKKSPHAFWSMFGPETPLFSLKFALKNFIFIPCIFVLNDPLYL